MLFSNKIPLNRVRSNTNIENRIGSLNGWSSSGISDTWNLLVRFRIAKLGTWVNLSPDILANVQQETTFQTDLTNMETVLRSGVYCWIFFLTFNIDAEQNIYFKMCMLMKRDWAPAEPGILYQNRINDSSRPAHTNFIWKTKIGNP